MTLAYLVEDLGYLPIAYVAQQEIVGHHLGELRVLFALYLGACVARVTLGQPPQLAQQPISVHALARARLLAKVFYAARPEWLAAYLRLARYPRRVAPDRLLQPQDRPPARTRRIRGTLPRVRGRPRGPARNSARSGKLVHRPRLK